MAFADKCWPAFPEQFGFEPCYVNSRLASRGIPVACEVDIYGALSEYIGVCLTGDAVTLLDINNSVPESLYRSDIAGAFPYTLTDTFMGFHCGNTPPAKMCDGRAVKYQLIQNRLLEDGGTRTSPGHPWRRHRPSPITFYRLQCDAQGGSGGTSPRARSCRWPPAPLAASASSPSMTWAASTGMCSWPSGIPTTARWPSPIAAGEMYEVFRYLGVTDIATTSPPLCRIPARILLHVEPPARPAAAGRRNFSPSRRAPAQIERSNLVEICILSDITDKIPLMILFFRCICDILGPVMEKGAALRDSTGNVYEPHPSVYWLGTD